MYRGNGTNSRAYESSSALLGTRNASTLENMFQTEWPIPMDLQYTLLVKLTHSSS